jgi:hypothetical protein
MSNEIALLLLIGFCMTLAYGVGKEVGKQERKD